MQWCWQPASSKKKKEITTHWQHIYAYGNKSSQKLIFDSIALEP